MCLSDCLFKLQCDSDKLIDLLEEGVYVAQFLPTHIWYSKVLLIINWVTHIVFDTSISHSVLPMICNFTLRLKASIVLYHDWTGIVIYVLHINQINIIHIMRWWVCIVFNLANLLLDACAACMISIKSLLLAGLLQGSTKWLSEH